MEEVKQFDLAPDEFQERKSVYAILIEDGKILVLNVNGNIHLPGGGVDEGEDLEIALARECLEELGAEIAELKFIGQANQYFAKSKYGPLNKLGNFYTAKMVKQDMAKAIEETHLPVWLTLGEFMESTASKFQKWAVQQALMRHNK